jgi:streptomycin 6-kinase
MNQPLPGWQAGGAPFPLPRNLADDAEERGRTEWIATLPATVTALARRWSLEIGDPFQPGGQTAWVAPARSDTLGDVVVKVAARHYEAFDEGRGLREWDGDGAVRLFTSEDVDESTTALLLERCRPGTQLSEQPDPVQDRVIAVLLPRLWKQPPFSETFRPLQQMGLARTSRRGPPSRGYLGGFLDSPGDSAVPARRRSCCSVLTGPTGPATRT